MSDQLFWLRFWFKRRLVDFCEARMHAAQKVAEKRGVGYGEDSWQWAMTDLQRRLWYKVACFFL